MVVNPVYFVLNACRVYSYLLERRIYSKEEGAVWALEQPGILSEQWQPIVSQALTVYRIGEASAQADCSEVTDFAHHVEAQREQLMRLHDYEDVRGAG